MESRLSLVKNYTGRPHTFRVYQDTLHQIEWSNSSRHNHTLSIYLSHLRRTLILQFVRAIHSPPMPIHNPSGSSLSTHLSQPIQRIPEALSIYLSVLFSSAESIVTSFPRIIGSDVARGAGSTSRLGPEKEIPLQRAPEFQESEREDLPRWIIYRGR